MGTKNKRMRLICEFERVCLLFVRVIERKKESTSNKRLSLILLRVNLMGFFSLDSLLVFL